MAQAHGWLLWCLGAWFPCNDLVSTVCISHNHSHVKIGRTPLVMHHSWAGVNYQPRKCCWQGGALCSLNGGWMCGEARDKAQPPYSNWHLLPQRPLLKNSHTENNRLTNSSLQILWISMLLTSAFSAVFLGKCTKMDSFEVNIEELNEHFRLCGLSPLSIMHHCHINNLNFLFNAGCWTSIHGNVVTG